MPPPMPIWAMSARMMSFAVTPVLSEPVTLTRKVFDGRCSRHCGGENVFDFAGSDAECERAECAMRGGVAIAADHGHAGLRQAQLGSDDMHDALMSRNARRSA